MAPWSQSALRGALLVAVGAVPGCSDQVVPLPGSQYVMRSVQNVSVPIKPGFLALPAEVPGKLVVTSFDPVPFLGGNAVFLVSVGGGLSDGEPQLLPGSSRIDWPNAPTGFDASVFGFPGVALGSGFLVPTHTTGGVWVMEASDVPSHLPAPVKITADKSGWFYHQAAFVDVDGDGLKDIVSARCEYGVLPWSSKQGELLWLKQPSADALNGQPWQESHLADGPDFLFCVQPGVGSLALAAAEYTSGRLVYYYMQDGSMQSRVLDAESGPGFSCSWVDLNGDGHLELLATNHLNQNGSVYAYTFDGEDVRSAAVTRHILATGFSATSRQTGFASPGDAIAFPPRTEASGKPFILLSGDNSNSVYVLVPRGQEADDWEYSVTTLGNFGADIGRPAVGDVDGDGFTDIYIPLYDSKLVAHYRLELASESSGLFA